MSLAHLQLRLLKRQWDAASNPGIYEYKENLLHGLKVRSDR
jgi:hypothetical protein